MRDQTASRDLKLKKQNSRQSKTSENSWENNLEIFRIFLPEISILFDFSDRISGVFGWMVQFRDYLFNITPFCNFLNILLSIL